MKSILLATISAMALTTGSHVFAVHQDSNHLAANDSKNMTINSYKEGADLYKEGADLYKEGADPYKEGADLYKEGADLQRSGATQQDQAPAPTLDTSGH